MAYPGKKKHVTKNLFPISGVFIPSFCLKAGSPVTKVSLELTS